MRPEENRFDGRSGFQRIVAAGVDQATANESDVGQNVKSAQESDAIDHHDR